MKKFLLSLLVLTITVTSSFAQKMGHINATELLAAMPEVVSADTNLEDFQKSLESEMQKMYADYQTKVQDYQAKAGLMADAIKQVKEKEIVDLEKRLNEFQTSANENIAKKKQELYEPILKKASDAVKEIAVSNGYAYVFDTSAGSLLYAQDSDNIMPLVKTKLGIK